MLVARKQSMWSREYTMEGDGRTLTTFRPSWWRSGGVLTLDGREYTVRHNAWGTKYEMTGPDGAPVASAGRVGRKNWTVETPGRTHHLRRASMWTGEQSLLDGDRPVGTIRRLSMWKGGATADLPGLTLAEQVFVVAVVLTMWDNEASAAASAGGAS